MKENPYSHSAIAFGDIRSHGFTFKKATFVPGKSLVMDISLLGSGLSIGELLFKLRMSYGGPSDDLYRAIKTSSSTYLKVERGQRELSLLMALRVCEFYRLDLHEFISLLSDEELGRPDYSVIKAKEKMERRKARAATKVIDLSTRVPHHR